MLIGVLQADPGVIRDGGQIFRLFCHEAQRVFHDRLINKEDKRYFNTILSEMSQKHFSQVWNKIPPVGTSPRIVFFPLKLINARSSKNSQQIASCSKNMAKRLSEN